MLGGIGAGQQPGVASPSAHRPSLRGLDRRRESGLDPFSCRCEPGASAWLLRARGPVLTVRLYSRTLDLVAPSGAGDGAAMG